MRQRSGSGGCVTTVLRRWLVCLLAWPCAVLAASPESAPPSPLALSCALCHGAGDAVPPLDALEADDIAARLRAFRDGRRDGVAMPRLVRTLDDAALDALARDVVALRALGRAR